MPLIFVPTPLGNLRDVTLRALDALRECDLLVAEDSRVARRLLSALQLPGKETWSYREQNAASVTEGILERAGSERVAVVTDAGTPGISDPGNALIAAARERGIAVELLPGASALVAAAVLSGFPLRRFIFEGFAPRAPGARRQALLRSFALGVPSVWFESPQRVRALLAEVASVDPAARVFLLREYTKRFEEQIGGTAAEVAERLPEAVRGEIALAVLPSAPQAQAADESATETAIDELLAGGESPAAIAKELAQRGLGERGEIYRRAAQQKRARRDHAATEQ